VAEWLELSPLLLKVSVQNIASARDFSKALVVLTQH